MYSMFRCVCICLINCVCLFVCLFVCRMLSVCVCLPVGYAWSLVSILQLLFYGPFEHSIACITVNPQRLGVATPKIFGLWSWGVVDGSRNIILCYHAQ